MADAYNLAQAGTLTPEQFTQQQQLNRQQQMANMLMQQSAQPQGQMISGRYVAPSWAQQLVPLANIMASKYIGEKADTEAAQLAKQIREGKTGAEEKIINYLTPQAAVPGQAPVIPQGQTLRDDNGMLTYGAQEGIAGKAATKPDLAAALREIRTNPYGVGKEYVPTILKQLHPEKPSSVLEFEYAKDHPELATYLMNKAAAGAGRNITYVGNKSIAEQVGPIMAKEQEKTLAANKIFDAANNLTSALDTNKIYTGTGANVKLGIAQLANTAGFGGNTLEEKIANTRTGIQSLAQLTLQGRKEMKGEGAIQVQEGQLAERAISGDINFTPTELKILANAAKRSAKYTQDQYERKLQHMGQDKETTGLVPYFAVPPMTPATPAGNDGWRIK